jgi:hypothetical protein
VNSYKEFNKKALAYNEKRRKGELLLGGCGSAHHDSQQGDRSADMVNEEQESSIFPYNNMLQGAVGMFRDPPWAKQSYFDLAATDSINAQSVRQMKMSALPMAIGYACIMLGSLAFSKYRNWNNWLMLLFVTGVYQVSSMTSIWFWNRGQLALQNLIQTSRNETTPSDITYAASAPGAGVEGPWQMLVCGLLFSIFDLVKRKEWASKLSQCAHDPVKTLVFFGQIIIGAISAMVWELTFFPDQNNVANQSEAMLDFRSSMLGLSVMVSGTACSYLNDWIDKKVFFKPPIAMTPALHSVAIELPGTPITRTVIRHIDVLPKRSPVHVAPVDNEQESEEKAFHTSPETVNKIV